MITLPLLRLWPSDLWLISGRPMGCTVWNPTGPDPPGFGPGSPMAIIATGAAVIGFLRLMPKARNLVRGEKGELKVAETLEDLRATGYSVFHDIKREGYNIDHVVVGPAGLFVIETKFRSGYGEIEFRNGEGLFVGGKQEEQDALLQARRNARDMNRLLKERAS